jgi:ATP-dependent DNA ligase
VSSSGIEGIVSKRKDAPYRSGKCDRAKVKTRACWEANRYRGELFT